MLREQWQRNLVGVLIAAFVSILGFNLVFPFLPLYIQTLGDYSAGEAAFWTGVIGALTGIAGSIAALVWGQLADRHGRRPMLIRATAGAALGLVVMGLAANIGMLLVGRLLFSALAGTVPAANPLIAANTPPERLGMAMGMLQSSVYLSNTTGPVIGGALAGWVGYRASFLVTAALYIASALPVMWLVRERFTKPEVTRGLVSGVTADFGEVMSNRPIAFPIIAALLALCAANVSTPIIALLVSEMVGQSRAEAMSGLAFGAQGLAAAVSALFVGRITSRVGFRGLLTISVPAGVLVYVAMWIVPGFWALAGLMAAQGLLQGAQIPALNALIAARAPRRRAGAVFGVVSSVNSLAFSGAPFLGGLIASAFGLRAVFPISAAFLVAMFALIGRATDVPRQAPARVGVAEEA